MARFARRFFLGPRRFDAPAARSVEDDGLIFLPSVLVRTCPKPIVHRPTVTRVTTRGQADLGGVRQQGGGSTDGDRDGNGILAHPIALALPTSRLEASSDPR